MTYQVVVADKDQNVLVNVDAPSEQSAKIIAQWVVGRTKRVVVHGTEVMKARN